MEGLHQKPSLVSGAVWLATDPARSRGRRHAEPESANRTAFQRDRDRIVHSTAFRRLAHKTQVFVYHEGDHYRTRLTHSLEVSQIARAMARTLGLNEDLAEALALAHDLGHTPFGHAGEDALAQCMAPYGGFDHNGQALRVVTLLEQRYAAFDGLNLTWETLEGLVKHNGPVTAADGKLDGLCRAFRDYEGIADLAPHTHPGPEAQVAALADDIAYNNHDIDDGLRAGLFDIDDLLCLPLVGDVLREVEDRWPGLARPRLVHETIRRLITAMVDDLVGETRRRIAAERPGSADDVRLLGRPLVAFSEALSDHNRALKDFLWHRMYRHYKVNRMMSKAKRIIADLFELYMAEPGILPTSWRDPAESADEVQRAILTADFIAGMTDRFAIEEHRRLFDLSIGGL